MENRKTGLKRPGHPMTDDIRDVLTVRGLLPLYDKRLPYQRNDYIGWITRAKRPETRKKRLEQMLDELESGDVYMKMAYRPKEKG